MSKAGNAKRGDFYYPHQQRAGGIEYAVLIAAIVLAAVVLVVVGYKIITAITTKAQPALEN